MGSVISFKNDHGLKGIASKIAALLSPTPPPAIRKALAEMSDEAAKEVEAAFRQSR